MAAPLIPLRHFFDNPERALTRLSPDGSRISWLAPLDGVLNVWVRPADGGEAVPVTSDRGRGIQSYRWSRDSRRILYVQDAGGDENYHLYAVDPGRPGRVRDLTPFAGVRAGLVAVPRATPRHAIVSLNLRDRGVFDAFRLTLATGRLELVGRNPGNVISWTADRQGRVRAAMTQTPSGDYQVLARDDEAGELRLVAEYANEDGGGIYAFTPDGAGLFVGSAKGSDLQRLVRLDIATGEVGPILSDRTGELLGVAYVRDRVVLHAHDERLRRDWERARELHPGDPAITGQDADESRWVLSFNDDRDPGATFLYDRQTGEAFGSPLDDDLGAGACLAYIARLPRPKDKRPAVIIAGLHAVGSLGGAAYLANPDNMRALQEQANGAPFSALVASEHRRATLEITSARIVSGPHVLSG